MEVVAPKSEHGGGDQADHDVARKTEETVALRSSADAMPPAQPEDLARQHAKRQAQKPHKAQLDALQLHYPQTSQSQKNPTQAADA